MAEVEPDLARLLTNHGARSYGKVKSLAVDMLQDCGINVVMPRRRYGKGEVQVRLTETLPDWTTSAEEQRILADEASGDTPEEMVC